MRERLGTFLAFGSCSVLLLSAMTFLTVKASSLEEAEARARGEARRQEVLRLALWRMDSWMTALIAREAARPWFHYQTFFPAERPYSTIPGDVQLEQVRPDEPLAASPLLLTRPEGARLYFQVAGAKLSSPQIAEGGLLGLALLADAKQADIERSASDLQSLVNVLRGTELGSSLGVSASSADNASALLNPSASYSRTPDQSEIEPQSVLPSQQSEPQTKNDYGQRQQIANTALNNSTNLIQNRTLRKDAQQNDAGATGAGRLVTEKDSKQEFQRSGAAPAPELLLDKAKSEDASGETRLGRAKELPAPAAVPPVTPAAPAIEKSAAADKVRLRTEPPGAGTAEHGLNENNAPKPNPVVSSPPQADPSPLAVACAAPLAPAPSREPQLFLTRHIATENAVVHQGIWLDWPVLRADLLKTIADLAPDAGLELVPSTPANGAEPADAASRMASIPARLTLGPRTDALVFQTAAPPAWSPTRTGLALGWVAIIAALAAIGMVLRASVQLSERRGRFVSAVTHELRTPLTTFTLYSQMLADGIVSDETARHEYHVTLRNEAQRLSRIVESVLDYAKLGKRSGGVRAEPIAASELLDRVLPALQARARDAGMDLVVEHADLANVTVRADHSSAERIILNLVDNACKYAADAADKRIHLRFRPAHSLLSIIVADHGPGIPPADQKKIFSPFQRGTAQSSGTTPGLGLGLAFARTLAEDLGGELRLTTQPDAATAFEFILQRIG